MTNNCYYKLNIDINRCFRNDFKFPTPSGNYGVWHPKAADVFNYNWLKYMEKIGVPLYTVMIFYRGPFSGTQHAHVDIGKEDPFELTPWGINWVFGGKGSSMVWYDLPNDGKMEINYTQAKTPYIYWYTNQLKEIERLELTEGTVALVNTALPHSIEMKEDPRWCFSVRTSIPDNQSWDEITEIFNKKNIIRHAK